MQYQIYMLQNPSKASNFLAIIFIVCFLNSCSSEKALEVRIDIINHKFEPSEVRVPSNKAIKLIIHNKDNTIEEFESLDLNREKIVNANSSINVLLPPLKKGKYFFFGEFHPKTAKGYIIVED